MSDEFDAIAPAAASVVTIGEGDAAARVNVRPLKLRQLPAFAAAVRPIMDRLAGAASGNFDVGQILHLIENDFDSVLGALVAATDAPREALQEATIDQALEIVLAVITANRDFLRGRLVTAVRTAASLTAGVGPTPSQP